MIYNLIEFQFPAWYQPTGRAIRAGEGWFREGLDLEKRIGEDSVWGYADAQTSVEGGGGVSRPGFMWMDPRCTWVCDSRRKRPIIDRPTPFCPCDEPIAWHWVIGWRASVRLERGNRVPVGTTAGRHRNDGGGARPGSGRYLQGLIAENHWGLFFTIGASTGEDHTLTSSTFSAPAPSEILLTRESGGTSIPYWWFQSKKKKIVCGVISIQSGRSIILFLPPPNSTFALEAVYSSNDRSFSYTCTRVYYLPLVSIQSYRFACPGPCTCRNADAYLEGGVRPRTWGKNKKHQARTSQMLLS